MANDEIAVWEEDGRVFAQAKGGLPHEFDLEWQRDRAIEGNYRHIWYRRNTNFGPRTVKLWQAVDDFVAEREAEENLRGSAPQPRVKWHDREARIVEVRLDMQIADLVYHVRLEPDPWTKLAYESDSAWLPEHEWRAVSADDRHDAYTAAREFVAKEQKKTEAALVKQAQQMAKELPLACPDTPIEGYSEETWVSREPEGEFGPENRDDCAAVEAAEQRLRARVARKESWPFCPQCQKPRSIAFALAFAHDQHIDEHRYVFVITAAWTCEEKS